MNAAGLPEPVFQKEGMFTVIFLRMEKSMEKSRVKIIEQVNANPKVTIPELAENIGISPKAIEKQISNLKKEGIIERIGSDKGGEWRVTVK
jgi:ATP-dependent DNA helicase RecG